MTMEKKKITHNDMTKLITFLIHLVKYAELEIPNMQHFEIVW